MTPEQQQILDYIREEIVRRGYAPTIRETMRHFGYNSTGPVHTKINRLVKDGYLVRKPGRDRGLALPGVDLKGVPTEQLRAELARREANHG